MTEPQNTNTEHPSKEALISLLLHDLQPALQSLKFLASSFSSSSHKMDQQKLLEYGQELNMAVEELTQSTTAIFTWLEVQRQTLKPKYLLTSAATILQETRAHFNKESPNYKANIICTAPADLQVYTDANALRIILHQLLRNAAAQKKGGTILLEASQQDGSTYLSVSDEGKGMSSRVAENVQAHLDGAVDAPVLYRYGYRIIIMVLPLLGGSIQFKQSASGGAKVIIIIPNKQV